MSEKVKRDREPEAVEGIRRLRHRLAHEVPGYAAAMEAEQEAEDFCRSIRTELRERRKLQGLDQGQLGEMIGLTQSAISRFERTSGDIGLKSIYRYARALGLRPFVVFAPEAEQLLIEAVSDPEIATARREELHQAAADFTGEQAKLMRSFSENITQAMIRLVNITGHVRDR